MVLALRLPQVSPRGQSALAAILLQCAACGGGGGGGGSSGEGMMPEPPAALPDSFRASAATPFAIDCNGAPQRGTLYRDAEVEPYLVTNPTSPANLVAVWQQDRWSNGAAQGLVAAASFDGGESWSHVVLPFSICAGGTVANGGDFARASDPWLAVSADGVLHALGLAVTGAAEPANASSAMLAARSLDGGLTWSGPVTLIREPGPAMNDKGSITADPGDARFVYAAWDRLTDDDRGPAWFARTMDAGTSWEAPRNIYDPGIGSQTIGNVIVVLPSGALVNVFTQIDRSDSGFASATLRSMASSNRGETWSAPSVIADLLPIGASDPETGQPIRDGSILLSVAVSADGRLHVVWQDARFSNGARDGIAYANSTNAGATWSPPVEVNGEPSVQAFLPTVHVRDDGVIGVTYYDLRSNTSSPDTLPTDFWLATSTDGERWTDTRVAAAFDLAVAPDAGGLFLGDYMGLTSVDREFFALYVTTAGDATDVFLSAVPIPPAAAAIRQPTSSPSVPASFKPRVTDEWRRRTSDLLHWTLQQRVQVGVRD